MILKSKAGYKPGERHASIAIDMVLKNMIRPQRCNIIFSKVLHDYFVQGVVRVRIGLTSDESRIVYCVDEPIADLQESDVDSLVRLVEALIAEGYEGLPGNMEELQALTARYSIPLETIKPRFIELGYYIKKGLSGYGPLYPLIADQYVEEIALDGPSRPVSVIHMLLPFGWIDTNIVLDEQTAEGIVLELARRSGRDVSYAKPYLEAILPEGHRVTATFGREISKFGTTIVVRKHREKPMTLPQLVKQGMLSSLLAAYLWLLILFRATILIIGPTASGKTTLLQALLQLVPPYYRIVTIEDTPELNLSHHPHWDSLVTRRAYSGSEEDIDMYKLAIFALRRRPDFFVIGEVRGEEARVFVHAAASGHAALTTFHADTIETALYRLKSPPINIDDSFLQLLWTIVVVRRVRIGEREVRKVVSIEEIAPNTSPVKIVRVAEWNPKRGVHEPLDVEELLSRSVRLQFAAEVSGLTMKDLLSLLRELEKHVLECLECSNEEFRDFVFKLYQMKVLTSLDKVEGRW